MKLKTFCLLTVFGLACFGLGQLAEFPRVDAASPALMSAVVGSMAVGQVDVTDGSTPVGGAFIRIYRTVDFDASNFTVIRASAFSDDNGQWGPVDLTAGISYTATFDFEGGTTNGVFTP